VNAQNEELQARINVLNSIAELDQAVGMTLETWQPLADLSPVLAEDALEDIGEVGDGTAEDVIEDDVAEEELAEEE
ncbi:MAG: hypothetical protein AAFV46_09355, partial [Cyanobacteria bacterium J06635_11]